MFPHLASHPQFYRRAFKRAVLCALLWSGGDVQAEAPTSTKLAMQLLRTNCISCHNEEKRKGGLLMTSREALLKGGDEGPVIVEGKPEESSLVTSLAASADPHMPPKKQLGAAQIKVIEKWVRHGMPWDAGALAGEAPTPRAVSLAALPPGAKPVMAIALSPDGTRLAVGCGNEVVVYDVGPKSLTFRARASAHLDAVQSLAWLPDGKRLVSGAFRRVMIWNAEPLTPQREILTGLADRITVIRPLTDGNQIAVADGLAGERGVVRLIDASTGAVSKSWVAHDDTIFAMALSSDGKSIATAGGDKFVRLWDLASGKESAKLEAHTTQVTCLAFNSDSTQLVTGGADRQLKVWDVKTRENTIALATKDAGMNAVTWSSNGPAVIACTDDGKLLRYTDLKSHTGAQSSDAAKERQLATAGASIYCLAELGSGERFFAGTFDGHVLSWDKDGKALDNMEVNAAPTNPPAAAPVSFVRDVLPVLGKAGCNSGTCHAKADGQNGFRLSVFSFDPQSDYNNIVRGARSRRVFPSDAAESLLLLKATQAIPHEGGERITRDSDAYRTLAQWISSGMVYKNDKEPTLARLEVSPKDGRYAKGTKQALTVQAHYSDGSKRDVTNLASFSVNDKQIANVDDGGLVSVDQLSGQAVVVARYMGLVDDAQVIVPADKLLPEADYATLPVGNFIDEIAWQKFKQVGLFPSAPCTDAEFLRRASLDTLGILPTVEEARNFMADTDPDKRTKAIDRLLAQPAYADHWAAKWADLLRPNPDRVGVKSVFLLDQWLRESFRQNKPCDQFAREIILTQGNTHRYGPSVIYRDRREPAELTTMFSQLFLGVRLDCAKCHHHPNEKWSQEDFYQMAAYFAPLKQKGGGISAPISGGNETFYVVAGGTQKHPVTGEIMKPKPPDGPLADLAGKDDPRAAFVEWMLDAKNPFFAKAMANRIWSQYFGKGIVDPVDDFRLSNPPSNPALMDALAAVLIRVKYDMKSLMKTIMSSHLYQLSSDPNETNKADTRNFSRAYRRRLGAEMMADAIADITGVANDYPGMPDGSRAVQAWTYKIESRTMDAFGRPNSSSDCPCERNMKPAIGQSLHLMNSDLLHAKLTSTKTEARLQKLAASDASPRDMVNEIYLACYARPATEDELQVATAAFTDDPVVRRKALEDVLWALLNSAEFVFNH